MPAKTADGNGMLLMPVYTEPDLVAMKEDAEKYARENGLKGRLHVDSPTRQEFNRLGHGYFITVRELEGKERMGTIQYTHDGKRDMWQQDGMITG